MPRTYLVQVTETYVTNYRVQADDDESAREAAEERATEDPQGGNLLSCDRQVTILES